MSRFGNLGPRNQPKQRTLGSVIHGEETWRGPGWRDSRHLQGERSQRGSALKLLPSFSRRAFQNRKQKQICLSCGFRLWSGQRPSTPRVQRLHYCGQAAGQPVSAEVGARCEGSATPAKAAELRRAALGHRAQLYLWLLNSFMISRKPL